MPLRPLHVVPRAGVKCQQSFKTHLELMAPERPSDAPLAGPQLSPATSEEAWAGRSEPPVQCAQDPQQTKKPRATNQAPGQASESQRGCWDPQRGSLWPTIPLAGRRRPPTKFLPTGEKIGTAPQGCPAPQCLPRCHVLRWAGAGHACNAWSPVKPRLQQRFRIHWIRCTHLNRARP